MKDIMAFFVGCVIGLGVLHAEDLAAGGKPDQEVCKRLDVLINVMQQNNQKLDEITKVLKRIAR